MPLINIVNYEEGFNDGILTKFAKELGKIEGATIKNLPDSKADINHHINYLPYRHTDTINTLMVTHIFEGYKIDRLREHIKKADMGICFSPQTMDMLIEKGLPREKLTYVLPAHDERPRRPLVISILTNVYPDGCKREYMLNELAKVIDKEKFVFRIMGKGWQPLLEPLVADGLQVQYFTEYDKDLQNSILDSADYYLYFGEDEGSMGLLDAVQAGVKTISTPQGFHLDIGLDYQFSSQEELNEIFKKLQYNPVEDWTWDRFRKQHIEIWNDLRHS